MKKLGYITGSRSAPLARFLSSAATSLPFLRRAFRKIKIGGTIKRKKFLKKWGVLVALNWTVKWGGGGGGVSEGES